METSEYNCRSEITVWNGDSEKCCITVFILVRYYYNCVSTVLAVFRFCMRVVLLLWVVEVLWSYQYYLRATLAVTYAWESAYIDVILACRGFCMVSDR